MKYILAAAALLSSPAFALAIAKATPGPLLGAVAGPWGLAAGVIGYGAYRFYKRKH